MKNPCEFNWFISTSMLFFFLSFYGCQHVSDERKMPLKFGLHNDWQFYADTSPDVRYNAQVPGCIHTDLLKAGAIPDPFYRNNELELRALENIIWVYENQFEVSPKTRESECIDLIFDGLDTYAQVFLNDQLLGTTANMFRTWKYDVKSKLRTGTNMLKIIFTPPRLANDEKAKQIGYTLPADNEEEDVKISPFSRKAPYHFGWDWGPRIIPAGIWKPIRLVGWNTANIVEASIVLDKFTGTTAQMQAIVFVEGAESGAKIKLRVGETEALHTLLKGENKISFPFFIEDAKRWWPNGHGDAHLYERTIELSLDNVILDQKLVEFGIRDVELVNQPDSIGTSFYFKINGKPIFAQGANYIPQDVFLTRVTDQQYRDLLIAAKDANMNMIRVWGGGVYEKDIFYKLCDSLGLMVWQDFMFAGTMYPGDKAFIENVSQEMKEQIRRLRKHPSLAVWCGNNELEVAWSNWGWQKKYNYSEFDSLTIWNDYLKLFRSIIPTLIAEESPELDYTPTSPLSNWGTAENFNHSTMHYWGVWHGRDDFNSFNTNVGRFMVEYGMQSYPELSTINKFAIPSDFDLESDVMKNRQKSYIGNPEILKHVKTHFYEPKNFEEFIGLSQDAQAKAMQKAIEAHKNSNGHCMGTLLWQLNDCWPGPSWSIIDYYGNKKKAYHAVQRAYANE